MHYVFTDDSPDSDPITSAALQVLDPSSTNATTRSTSLIASARDGKASNGDGQGRNVKERYVLLEMDSSGTKIESAASMSPDWAITGTEVGPAPTWERDGEGMREGRDGRGLMLRIEGLEVRREEGKGGDEGEEKRLEELVEVYERQMVELRRVVDSGQGVGMGGASGR